MTEVLSYPVGIDLMAEGRFHDALAPLRLALSLGDTNPLTLINLAIAEDRAGDRVRGRRLMRQIAIERPEWDEPVLRLAESLRATAEWVEAEEVYNRVLAINPNRKEALIALSGLLIKRGNFVCPRDLLIRACGVAPNDPVVWHTLGMALRATGAPSLALSAFVRAQNLRPSCLDYVIEGVDVTLEANAGEAELARLTLLCEKDALNPAFHAGRGLLLDRLGHRSDAIDALEVAVELSAGAIAPLRLLGQVLARSPRLLAAEDVLRRICALDPDNMTVRNVHAVVLMRMHRFPEARKLLLGILERGMNASVMCNLANATVYSGDQDEAMTVARHAIEIAPNDMQTRRASCIVMPYHSATTGSSLLAAMRACADALPRSPQPPFVNIADSDRPLVIGLLSGSFRTHPVGWLTIAGFEALDPDRFQIVCLAQNDTPENSIARRFRTLSREWIDIDHLSDPALSVLTRERGIDVLIDLGGYGDAGRMAACANRLAPVQIKWVGMQCHSSGLAEMDWFLTDRWESPAGFEHLFSERLLRLPDGYVCYAPPPHAPDVTPPPALINGFVTFGCFNNVAKITPQVIETWAAILHRIPTARIILKAHQFSSDIVVGKFHAKFTALGIATDRIELRGSSPHRKFMGEYRDVDIVLDPFPYSGGLTTCEALWMGVPTITLPGEIFASRHSASHLSNAGLADWITNTVDEYIEAAVARAANPAALAEQRETLREQVRRSPLCDAPRFGRSLGAALRHTWRVWCAERSTEPAADT